MVRTNANNTTAMTSGPAVPGSLTVSIETHGCKLNQADSQVLASQFEQAGFRIVAEGEPADVCLVNTCTVTHVADRKARQALRAARRANPGSAVVATGCYAQRAPQALRGLPEADLVAGNSEKAALVQRVLELSRRPIAPRAVGEDSRVPVPAVTRTRAMVKIQEGCDQVCAYCIVPKVRGRERSIPPEDLLRGINDRVSAGHREVVLTGTQLGSYGFDLSGIDLAGLLERILSESAVLRLRVSSIQPQEVDGRILELWSDRRLCPHFHLALQSGSDAVLKRMRRRYSSRQYMEAVDMIRRAVPDVSITTDVIVGFPGETEDDFARTYDLCERVGFGAIHVFPYSARPGTSAAHFGGGVDPETKAGRVRDLLALSRHQAAAFRGSFLGSTRQVLWEGLRDSAGPDHWVGLTDNYIRVIGQSSTPLANQITPARLLRQEEDLVFAQVLA